MIIELKGLFEQIFKFIFLINPVFYYNIDQLLLQSVLSDDVLSFNQGDILHISILINLIYILQLNLFHLLTL